MSEDIEEAIPEPGTEDPNRLTGYQRMLLELASANHAGAAVTSTAPYSKTKSLGKPRRRVSIKALGNQDKVKALANRDEGYP